MKTNEVTINGVVEKIYEKTSRESKGKVYNSQLIILVDNSKPQYQKKIAISLKGTAIEKLAEGQEVNLVCSVESREWNGKWFTDINCWNVETEV